MDLRFVRRNGGPQCHGRLHVDYMLTMITMMCSDVLHQLYVRYVFKERCGLWNYVVEYVVVCGMNVGMWFLGYVVCCGGNKANFYLAKKKIELVDVRHKRLLLLPSSKNDDVF